MNLRSDDQDLTSIGEDGSGDAMSSNENRMKKKRAILHNDMHDHVAAASNGSRHPGKVSRTLVNFWLDGVLALVFFKLCVTAVVVQFVFPPGIVARNWTLWGMSYGQWCSVQFGLIATLGLGVLVHVMLHWTWVCSVMTKRVLHRQQMPDDGIRTVYGVGLLIGLLLIGAVTVGIAQWMIIRPQ